MSEITYNKKCIAMGKNGISYQLGLDIYQMTRIDENNIPFDVLVLNPINSYGQLTKGWTEIPLENVNELIKSLQQFENDNPF